MPLRDAPNQSLPNKIGLHYNNIPSVIPQLTYWEGSVYEVLNPIFAGNWISLVAKGVT
uniref:Uncharacterized protein n=1 Tax=Solanum tuberosum TaxID=4113 RepID=M1D136_SOLTU